MKLERMLCGVGKLAKGTLQACSYEQATDRFALSFSTATSPSQIYTIEGDERQSVRQHTRSRVLGLPKEWLSAGEDASFTSYDGLRISARLYLPTPALGMEGPHPLVYCVSMAAQRPGATQLHLVLDTADSVLDPQWFCGLCAQCAREHWLWTRLHKVGRP